MQLRRYYSFTHHQLCQISFLSIKIPHLINSKTAAFKTTWKLLLCCSTMICKVVNIWLFLCWVCCVVLGQKLVLRIILDMYIYAYSRAIWAHFRRNAGKKNRQTWEQISLRPRPVALSFKHFILPELHLPYSRLLYLAPNDSRYWQLYRFDLKIQTFHALFHTDHNVLLGAPTDFGKTVAAELAMLSVFESSSLWCRSAILSLPRERIVDWHQRLDLGFGRRCIYVGDEQSAW